MNFAIGRRIVEVEKLYFERGKLMRKKIKCNVCGLRLEPKQERIVEKKSGFLLDITMTYYDVMDCPKCGCEITLQVRHGVAAAEAFLKKT